MTQTVAEWTRDWYERRFLGRIPVFIRLRVRYGWYTYRKSEGHPITLRRAFFSQPPRFGSYEEHEVGCPDWALRDYKLVAIQSK